MTNINEPAVAHSPEPWYVENTSLGLTSYIHAPLHKIIADTGLSVTGKGGSEQLAEANARRIVACVNLCAGFDTEALKDADDLMQFLQILREKYHNSGVEHAKLKANHLALEASLIDILARFSSCIADGGQIPSDHTAIDKANIAIAQAKRS